MQAFAEKADELQGEKLAGCGYAASVRKRTVIGSGKLLSGKEGVFRQDGSN